MGLPERNPGTGGQKGRARETLWLQLQTGEAGFPGSIVYDVSCSNTEVGEEERADVQKCFTSLDKIHTLFYILAFLCEHKDKEIRMFVSIFSNTSNFP